MKTNARPPRDGLVRARPGIELREDGGGDSMPTLHGHFARFNEWTEIDSIFEGRFLEQIAPGAFKKTFREQREGMKVLFQHGHDPAVGDKPLGPIRELGEDGVGAAYEVPLLDTTYNRDLLPGLEEGLYGASFRFRVIRESINEEPERSDENPDAIPERTIEEARVFEFGPVTFPAYEGATAGVRSLTDELIFERMAREPERMRELLDFAAQSRALSTEDLPAPGKGDEGDQTGAEGEPHSDKEGTPEEEEAGAATSPPGSRTPLYDGHQKEKEAWRL